jgi:hypothetical protein
MITYASFVRFLFIHNNCRITVPLLIRVHTHIALYHPLLSDDSERHLVTDNLPHLLAKEGVYCSFCASSHRQPNKLQALFAIHRERGKQNISEHRPAENTIELSSNVPKEDSIQSREFRHAAFGKIRRGDASCI